MKKGLIILSIFLLLPINIFASGLNDTGKSSIVMDIDTGRILYQKDSNTERLIASTSKIMTFLVTLSFFQNQLDTKVKVGEEVLKMYGTNMYLNLGEELTIRELLYGLMMRSGNDASVVLAVNVAGSVSEFVMMMNKKAQEIGMQNTIFKNPHGLDEETKNYSTAYDLAILTRYLYLNYPEYKKIVGEKYYDFSSSLKSYSLVNRCKILFTYKNTTTAKNGYTPLAGKSLVTTATKNDLNLLVVTLDDYDIYQNHERLYEYYFNRYKKELLLDKNNFKIAGLVPGKYYLKNNFYYPITKDELNNVNLKVLLEEKNNTFGCVQILLKEKIIGEEVIYKMKEKKKEKKSLFLKIKNFFKNMFNDL